MAKFIYTATVVMPHGANQENIPVFAFTWGVAGRVWESAKANNIQDLKSIADQVDNENNGLSIAVPVPIATKLFPLRAHYQSLQIFVNDKLYDPNAMFDSIQTLGFDGVTVVETHPLPKPSGKGSAVPLVESQITNLQRKGILPTGLAYISPQAVKLTVKWGGVHY